jgi:hypothetical protein
LIGTPTQPDLPKILWNIFTMFTFSQKKRLWTLRLWQGCSITYFFISSWKHPYLLSPSPTIPPPLFLGWLLRWSSLLCICMIWLLVLSPASHVLKTAPICSHQPLFSSSKSWCVIHHRLYCVCFSLLKN